MRIRIETLRIAAQRALLVLVAVGTAAVSGCADTPGAKQSARQAAASDQTSCSLAEYRIGAGDQLDIFVFNEKDLSVTVPVRPDGTLSMPLVDRVQASGKTTSELGQEIEQKLSEYIRSPKVNVIVKQFVGTPDEQIQVMGQGVTKPMTLPYRHGIRVSDVIIQVGGLSQFASANHARIVRREPGGRRTEIRVKLGDLLDRGDTRQNKEMCPGDLLIVPESVF